MAFVKKPLLCDKDVMHTNNITTYGLHTQESLREYINIVNSKQVDLKSRRNENGSGYKKIKKGHLPSQIGNVTRAVKRAIFRKTASQREMVLVVIHPRSP